MAPLQSEKKRPRTSGGNTRNSSNNNEDDVLPPAIVESRASPVADAAASAVAPAPQLIEPVLSEIPKLLLDLQKDNIQDVESALDQLEELISTEKDDAEKKRQEENQREASSLGANYAILSTMRKWQHAEDVQCMACQSLRWLPNTLTTTLAIIDLGGLEALVNALKLFPDSDPVQQTALDALGCLFWDLEEKGNILMKKMCKHAERFVNELGGIELTVKGMDKFPDHEDIQHEGCALLCALSCLESIRKAMVKAGAARVVVAALEEHDSGSAESKRIQKNGKKCMQYLFA